jgi:uncharacterized protein (TIGR02246 family)
MRKILFVLAATAIFVFSISCGNQPASNSTANANAKPANAAGNSTAAAPAGDTASAEAEVRKLMDTAQAALAKNDADTMATIYADNYMLVNLDGSVQTKAERLASLRSGEAKYSSFIYSEPNIRITPGGDEAVVIAKLALKGVFRGKPTDGDYRVTQVYSKTKDGWKQISAQATAITAAASPAATSNSNANAGAHSNTNSATNK